MQELWPAAISVLKPKLDKTFAGGNISELLYLC